MTKTPLALSGYRTRRRRSRALRMESLEDRRLLVATPIAYWAFDDAGQLGLDLTGSGDDLTVFGGAAFEAGGYRGGAVSLDGSDDYLGGITPSGLPVGDSPYTIAVWMKPDTLPSTDQPRRGMIGWGNYGTGNTVNAVRIVNPNGLNNYWWGADLNVANVATVLPGKDLDDGQWHHVAATYDGTTRTLYVDGQFLASNTPSSPGVQAMNFAVGRTAPQFNEYFDGLLDDVAIWDTALPPSDVEGLADGTLVPLIANFPPVAVNDGPYQVDEDGSLSVVEAEGVLDNDTDTELDALTAVLVDDVTHGTLTLYDNGSFDYQPDADFFGADSFTYVAHDGQDSNVATATIDVAGQYDAATAVPDQYVAAADGLLTVDAGTGVLANDLNPDQVALTAVLVDDADSGTLQLHADGSFTYEPDTGFVGTDAFTYKANDTVGDSNTVTVTLLVDAAPVAAPDSYQVQEDHSLTVSAADGVLDNDTDAEDDPLTAVLVTDVAHGTLALGSDGAFQYTPDADFDGVDSFVYAASDGDQMSAPATVTIQLIAVNDPPVARDDDYLLIQNESLHVAAGRGVLANDTDVDGPVLSVELVADVLHGSLTLAPDGSFSYTPAAGFTGIDRFTYRASDSLVPSNVAVVTLTVLSSRVMISEFLASNDDNLLDEDGRSADWIELYNFDDEPVDLEGWHLTDNSGNLAKWTFPATTIGAGEFLVVFASGEDRAVSGSELHTDFKLEANGEYLALVEPDGVTVASEHGAAGADYPQQFTDISYGVVIASEQTALIGPGAAVAAFVPTDGTLGDTWIGAPADEPFDDSPAAGWIEGAAGVGFPVSAAGDFVDEFGDGALDGSWTLDNPGTATVTEGGGVLQMDVPNGNNAFATRGTAPFLYRDAPADGDYSIITHVDTATLSTTATAGIIVYDAPDGHYDVGLQWGNNSLALVHGPGTFPVNPVPVSGTTGAYLRLDRGDAADSWTGYYKVNEGDDWTLIGSVTEGNEIGQIDDPRPGLMARTDGGAVVAEFDFFQIDASGSGSGSQLPIQLDLQTEMQGTGAGAFIRVPFTVVDPDRLDWLTLQVQYDDGFVAYLNGVEVARRNAPASVTWDSSAPAPRPEEDLLEIVEIDISSYLGELRVGQNILAIHGLNVSAGDDDFLINPQLLAGTAPSEQVGYFVDPTPGQANGQVSGNFGPAITDVTQPGTQPADNEDIVVTAVVAAVDSPVDTVTLTYRVMYQPEASVPMVDDGSIGGDVAGDGVFTAVIPADAATINEMIRWYVTADDVLGTTSRAPLVLAETGMPQYFGVVIADPSIVTPLPQFHWFVEDDDWFTNWGNGGGGGPYAKNYTTASIYYGGEFYDHVDVRIRGASSVFHEFPKQSLKFEFHPGHYFRFSPDEDRVPEINLNALWQDKGYIRNQLAMEVYRDAGVEYSVSFMMYTHRNGAFHSVSSFVEQVDGSFLERQGRDPDGALYKVFNSLADSTTSPPFVPGVHGGTGGGVEKKTRRWEDNSDLQALIDGLRTKDPTVLFDILDVPSVISYLAASVIVADWDMTRKNWYVYRDTEGTGEWSAIAWDRDNSWGYPGWMNDNITVITNPLFHDNRTTLHDAIYDVPILREMYLRRLRTVLDELLQPPGTPAGELKLDARIDEIWEYLHTDVDADKALWGNPWGQSQNLGAALDVIKNNYLAPARNSLYANGLLPPAQQGGAVVDFTTLVASAAAATAWVPTDSGLGDTWTGDPLNEPFDDSAWTSGTTGVGYERDSGYEALIGLDVDAAMASNDSVYIRIPFEVTDLTDGDVMRLKMKYDDGFVAYINGVQVAAANDPAPLAWDSSATTNHADAQATSFQTFDVSTYLGELVVGDNVLAIHGLNDQTGGTVGSSSDMLILPELEIGTTTTGNPDHPAIHFGQFEGNPVSGNQDEEYIELVNNNDTAIDVSGWELDGGVDFTFAPGTVIPAGGSLYVSPDVAAFRGRASGPSGGQGLFVQGGYRGHISNLGEQIDLLADDGTLISSVVTPFIPSDAQRYLRISEIMYHPANPTPTEQAAGFTDDDDFEFLELINTSDTTTLDLTGVTFTDGIDFAFAAGTMLPPGERILVVRDEMAFAARYDTTGLSVAGEYRAPDGSNKLSNGGETLKIEDADNSTIQEFAYNDSVNQGWPASPDGDGHSLEAVSFDDGDGDPALWNDYGESAMWYASVQVGGSPGVAATAAVLERFVFYEGSAFDAANDDDAIAPDKTALLPGETATAANYTNYEHGINGVIVDVAWPTEATLLTDADFTLLVGNDDDPGSWTGAATPVVVPVEGAGRGGSDRVYLSWPSGAPTNTWLQVITRSDSPNTGLIANDVFYFGNAIGETGNDASNALVTAADVIAIRDNPRSGGNRADLANVHDVNRDRFVNATDALLARNAVTGPFNALRLITSPLPSTAPPEAEGEALLADSVPEGTSYRPPYQDGDKFRFVITRRKAARATESSVAPSLERAVGVGLGWLATARHLIRPENLSFTVPVAEPLVELDYILADVHFFDERASRR